MRPELDSEYNRLLAEMKQIYADYGKGRISYKEFLERLEKYDNEMEALFSKMRGGS